MDNITAKQLRHIIADYLENDTYEYCGGKSRSGDKFSAPGVICQITCKLITDEQWTEQDKLYKSPKWFYIDHFLELNQVWRVPIYDYPELNKFKNSFLWKPGKKHKMSFACVSDLLGKRPGWNIVADHLRKLN